ncbi:MAG: hypothetical protein U9Q80_06660 [Bacillota bacterium]|nr:hypothetical protein [Bacillota bacterium]
MILKGIVVIIAYKKGMKLPSFRKINPRMTNFDKSPPIAKMEYLISSNSVWVNELFIFSFTRIDRIIF